MADIRINQLPAATGGSAPVATDNLAIDGASTRRATIQQVVDTGAPIATQSEAIAGTNGTKRMTPLTTKQSIAAEVGVTLASAAQGGLADSALQPGEAATPSQGAKADAALPRNEYAFFDTEALFQASIIPSSVNEVRTNGYYAAGDGGGHAKKRISTPSPVQAWQKQSADGTWWEISRGQETTFEMFGIVKNSSPTDLTVAGANASRIQNAIKFVESDPTLFYKSISFGNGAINFCPSDTIVILKPISIIGSGRGVHLNNSVYERALNGECSMLQLVGTGTKKVCTRRNYRASASDPNDDPISVGFTVESTGVEFHNFHASIYCNYPADGGVFPNSAEKDNLGANWDVFVKSSRQAFRWESMDFSGYARYCQVLIDSTRTVNMPELNPVYFRDTHGAGTDGWGGTNFRSIGGTFLRVLGPNPKTGLLHPGFQYRRGARFSASGLPSVGDTVTIGSETFTFVSSRTKRFEVTIGSTIQSALNNLRAEWLFEKQAPYETLTLYVNGNDLEIYSTSSTATPLSDTSGSISVQQLGSATAATQTETISDPAPFYDWVSNQLYDDGRNSLGSSDGFLNDFVISVAHHSGYQQTAMRPDKNQNLESDSSWGCIHIDGFGGRIAIHKWYLGVGRFESVEPFTVRLGLATRGTVASGAVFDSNITAYKSKSTDNFLTTADTYGKGAGNFENVCLVTWASKDSPGNYFPDVVGNLAINGNTAKQDFRLVATDVLAVRNVRANKLSIVGERNFGTDIGYTDIICGASGQSDIRFSSENNSQFSRIRGNPADASITFSVKTGIVGAITSILWLTDLMVRALKPVQLPTYTIATLPTASTVPRSIAYVSDGVSNKKIAFSDGGVWRYMDGTTV